MDVNNDDSSSGRWENLLNSIRSAVTTEDVNKTEIIQILSDYNSVEEDWTRYAFFDDDRYTRNLVDNGNGIYNLMVLAWNPGQGSCIHDHCNSSCFVKVLAGNITEIRYEIPKPSNKFREIGSYMRRRDEVAYIDNSIGIHEMRNDTVHRAVSLHLYIPPFDVCTSYDRETAAIGHCHMTFSSIKGEINKEE